MTATSDRYWYRAPDFDDATMAEFERRLRRARPGKRPGYLRIKGAILTELGDPRAAGIGIALLERVIAEYGHLIGTYPYWLEVPWAHGVLADTMVRRKNWAAAEHHYRAAMAAADPRGNGLPNVPELYLARVLWEQGGKSQLAEAAELVSTPSFERRLVFNNEAFLFCVMRARLADILGESPAPWARQALKLAAITEPQLPRHPDIGLVRADDQVLRELRSLADGSVAGRRRSWTPWRRRPAPHGGAHNR